MSAKREVRTQKEAVSCVPYRLVSLAALSFAVGCGSETPASSDSEKERSEHCLSDSECRDGIFCNGDEVCDPTSPGADDFGCRNGLAPCGEWECLESDLTCGTDCPDLDGDGHRSVFCGGDDCDDGDPDRYPGNTELCNDRDEDCDPFTFGSKDEDGDGSIDEACCNGENCGQDCDDETANISRLAPEVCDGVDNDCDGLIDDGVLILAYPDLDLDGFGDESVEPEPVCLLTLRSAHRGGDCNDADAEESPGARELCDGLDSNCDGEIDNGADAVCAAVTKETSSVCIEHADASGFQCRGSVCTPGFGDCDGDPENGCEVDLCSSALHCDGCGNACGAERTCSEGVCSSQPVSWTVEPGIVRDALSGEPLAGAQVQVQNACGGVTAETDALGEFTLGMIDTERLVRVEKSGYATRFLPVGPEYELFSFDDLAAMTDSGEPPLSERTGLIIVDYDDEQPPTYRVSSPSGAPVELPGFVEGTIKRVLYPHVSPGTVKVDTYNPGFGCFTTCDGGQTLYLEGGAVLHVSFTNCASACYPG